MARAIKKTISRVAIALLTAGGLTSLYRMRVRNLAPLLRVIEFHDLQDAGRFSHILTFVKTHYHVVTPGECFSRKLDASRINVLVTFDDGYASWINVALPVLSALDIKALFFVNSGLLDVHGDEAARDRYIKDRLLIAPRETLSWNDLRALSCSGHTVGGHTTSHSRLSTLPDHELRAELENDKKRIEKMLETEITAFAYPFGQHTIRSERFLRDAGYTHAFSNEARFAMLDNPLRLPRLPVDEAISITVLQYTIEGGCDTYEMMKALLGIKRMRIASNVATVRPL